MHFWAEMRKKGGGFMSLLRRMLPAKFVHRAGIFLRHAPGDFIAFVAGKRRDPLIPPRRLIFVGDRDFKAVGDEFLGHFRNLGGLGPGDCVLDIGCGIGRMARPLAPFLGPHGRYEGFDIAATGIDWCNRNFTPRYPNFRFQISDVYNKLYNPRGAVAASDYVFPYPDATFDFAFATSVFTHMFPADITRYVKETRRVLKPGGRALLTFFVWDDESARLVAEGRSAMPFVPYEDFWTWHPEVPEDAVAVAEPFITRLAEESGLRLEGIHRGTWCGRDEGLSFQDLVLFSRPA